MIDEQFKKRSKSYAVNLYPVVSMRRLNKLLANEDPLSGQLKVKKQNENVRLLFIHFCVNVNYSVVNCRV